MSLKHSMRQMVNREVAEDILQDYIDHGDIAVGDIFVTRGYAGDEIQYHITDLMLNESSHRRYSYPKFKPMVEYVRHHVDKGESFVVRYPIEKFLYTKASTHMRKLAVRAVA